MRLRLALLAIVCVCAGVPATAEAADPLNDDYESARRANQPGTVYPNGATVEWSVGPAAPGSQDFVGTIDEADTQGNMNDSSSTNENLNLTCPPPTGSTYIKTVWYYIFPDVNGVVQISTGGGDAVVRLMTINPGPGATDGNNTPIFSDSLCVDDQNPAATEVLTASVLGGPNRRYAVQVGVYDQNPTFGTWGSGTHLTRISFFRDRDLDGTLDTNDRCPTAVGPSTRNGCPDSDGDGIVNIDDRCPTVRGGAGLRGCPDGDGDGIANIDDRCATQNSRARDANRNGCLDLAKFRGSVKLPSITLFSRSRGRFVRNGVKISNLTVSGLPKGTSVRISCSRRSICRPRTKSGSKVNFKTQLKGKRLRPGRSIIVRLSKSGYVTRRFKITARAKGKRGVKESNSCVVPGTKRLRACSKVSGVR